jgi:hypothetical protein
MYAASHKRSSGNPTLSKAWRDLIAGHENQSDNKEMSGIAAGADTPTFICHLGQAP